MNSNNHSGFDPVKEERYEQKHGEDPNLAAREEAERKSIQTPAREYFEKTLEKATRIVHGFGFDRRGAVSYTTYLKGYPEFETVAIFEAKKLLMVYFTYVWYGEDPKPKKNKMEVADKYWRYTLTEGHSVEVHHE